MKSKISLRDWINQEGVSKIAEQLCVEQSTVRHWRSGHCLPKAQQMREIKKLSKGQVTYDVMIDEHFSDRGQS